MIAAAAGVPPRQSRPIRCCVRDAAFGGLAWTLDVRADAMVRLTSHDALPSETVRRRRDENGLKPWWKKMWCKKMWCNP